MTSRDLWTRKQLIIAFHLYCQIPFNKTVKTNLEVIRVANLIGRSPSALARKLGNFGSFDPELKKRGISGLSNVSKLDKQVWDEFHLDWENLVVESEKLLQKLSSETSTSLKSRDEEIGDIPSYSVEDKLVMSKAREGHTFFRNSVLASYQYKCCITGLSIPELLVASHIIPWSKDKSIRLNPQNGLCLNSLHDKAFDKGLLTITPNFKVILSSRLCEIESDKAVQQFFYQYSSDIKLPDKFIPKPEFLEYHNQNIFLG